MLDYIDDIQKAIIKDLEASTKAILIKNKVEKDSVLDSQPKIWYT